MARKLTPVRVKIFPTSGPAQSVRTTVSVDLDNKLSGQLLNRCRRLIPDLPAWARIEVLGTDTNDTRRKKPRHGVQLNNERPVVTAYRVAPSEPRRSGRRRSPRMMAAHV